MDNKKLSLVTLLDLSKAFDSVDHVTLLEKLTKVQIDTLWFSHYLKDRSQVVKTSNVWLCSGCRVVQYADDTQLVHTGSVDAQPDLIERAEITLYLAKKYSSSNGLMFNSDKIVYIYWHQTYHQTVTSGN